MKKLSASTWWLILLLLSCPSLSVASPLFGPVDYQAGWFGITWDTVSFPATAPGQAVIHLEKLSPDKRYYGGRLTYNGEKHSLTDFFKSSQTTMDIGVTLEDTNQLKGNMYASPGAGLRVTVIDSERLQITITSPQDQELISTSAVTVTGQVESSAEFIQVRVNGRRALIKDNTFYVNNLELVAGSNRIIIQAMDSQRKQGSTSRDIFRVDEPEDSVELEMSYQRGFAPLTTRLHIIPHLQYEIDAASATFELDGPGEVSLNALSDTEYEITITDPGLYTIYYQVTDKQGTVHDSKVFVSVLEVFTDAQLQAMKDRIQSLEDLFISALASGTVESAREAVLVRARTYEIFSSVTLSSSSLCLTFRGIIPVILDLADPTGSQID